MTEQPNSPQLYLITPVGAAASTVGPLLADVMDRFPVACLRIPGAGSEDELGRIADLAREIAHARDVALVIERHVLLAQRLGLDGVHLTDGARSVRYARKELGPDAIVGAFCGASRHDGMNAGEMGADYVAFGPAGTTALGTGERAGRDLFAWWTEMIELPVVAEGALDPATVAELESVTDFFAFGEEIWRAADPAAALKALIAEMG